VPWLLARAAWLAGAGVSALVVTCWAGRVPVLRNPTNGNRAMRLTHEQSRYGVANAAAAHCQQQVHTLPLLRC
jgi:putative hemolysin